jgi:hypothetical protein
MSTESMIGLGRRVSKDDRDYKFKLPRREVEAKEHTNRYWSTPHLPLDQGNTPQCVAYSGMAYLLSGPIFNQMPMSARSLYRECQMNDEWDGEDYEGTSVRALFKVLKNINLIGEYRWAFDVGTVVNHVLTQGPVVMGTNWYMDMFMPTVDGDYLEATGGNVGGHAWLIIGANKLKHNPDGSIGALRMLNSWGPNWGEHGRAWLTFKTLAKLIDEDGEAGVATEIKVRGVKP